MDKDGVLLNSYHFLSIHIKDIWQGFCFRAKHPEHLSRSMNQFIDLTPGIGQISKNSDISGTGSSTGCSSPIAFFKFCVVTKITLIDGPVLFIKISGIVRAGSHTGLAANAFVRIHAHNTVYWILKGSIGWTDTYTWGVVAVIAEDRHENTIPLIRRNGDAALQYIGPITMGRDSIGTPACLQATFTIDTMIFSNYHGVVRTVGKISHWYLAAAQGSLYLASRGQRKN